MNLKNTKLFFIVTLTTIIILSPSFALASETNGTIDSTYKYAWSENIGWINFGVSSGNVTVNDTSMTGYAWSDNYGWINLNPSDSGVVNNGEGALSGQAWGENTGWINFSGVTIDSSGYFSGYASSTITGRINFNCSNTSSCAGSDFKIRTDWRPQSVRPACNNSLDDDGDGKIDYPSDPGCSSANDTNETDSKGEGGFIPGTFNTSSAPAEGLKVIINSNASTSTSRIVNLSFNVGSNIKKIAISNTGDFKGASQEPYTPTRKWDLCSKFGGLITYKTCPEKTYRVYVKFYTRFGQSSKIISNSIIYRKNTKKIVSKSPNTHFVFKKNIKLRDSGNSVKKLQQFLNQNNFKLADSGPGSPGNETEYFGSITKKALIKFQNFYASEILTPIGLTKGTGVFGPSTRVFVNSFSSPKQSVEEIRTKPYSTKQSRKPVQPISIIFTKTLRFGMQNDDVKKLQQLLNSDPDTKLAESGLGSPENETSYFGRLTRDAVRKFQKKYNIVSVGNERTTGYGLVGPKTRTKFNELF